MTATAATSTALAPEHLFHLLMARNWLAIGSVEEARREFQFLPLEAWMHPEAQEVRRQLFSGRQNDEHKDKKKRPPRSR